ncbi:GTPase IMAP family member 8-like [Colossoma macropomum]|uniref:GTPase IMAP family member 8-like n=1 Tax=Colossoma macropomum TaxID=42526 RepID=UPI001863FA3D|nr:GTPase IMAP family member 8-like [Colossoma macropomum]
MTGQINYHSGVEHSLSELRIVLLGCRNAGKSSAGNTILNREEFELKRTAQCVKRQREVAGRHITVVEAPGWWNSTPVEESTELLKQEIVLSVSLCPPGPHCLLLVISTAIAFKKRHREVLEGYLKLLGDTVWKNTIVLFTCGDFLLDTPIEQHIESGGKELQELVEKCGNRYHVLNSKILNSEGTKLLDKIKEMVAANSGCYFDIGRRILHEVEEERRAEEERTIKQMMKHQKQKEHVRSWMGISGHFRHLVNTSIEQNINIEGKELQWLGEKYRYRHHVLNNENRSDDTQVTELLEKIEEMVAANSGRHFEMDRKILQGVEEKRRAEEERAKERMMKVQKHREDLRSHMCDALHLSDLRIVLLGYIYSGKSSVGNIILNREEFELKRTARCVKRQREVAGRHITVIEAPGWFWNELVDESTELLKQEIVLSVSLCPPGPHAVLLIIRVDTVNTKANRKILDGYLELLTDTVWSHTIVLFTFGDWLGDTPIEQHIESEVKELQWLVEKCGNRYHVLNNENRSDDTQVTELLEKIEEMVAANSGRHFEVDRKILQEVEEKRRAEEERAKERMMKVQKQRKELRSHTCDTYHLSELRIVLLGCRYAGKSSVGNTILKREEFELKTTAQCVKRQGDVAGRHITVVEAPGWWINRPVEESAELLKQEIVLCVSLCPPGPNAVLLTIRVDTMFNRNGRKIIEGYLKLFTERVWHHTLVLFTFGDFLLDTPIEQYIESEVKELQWLVEKCGNRYHVLNNENRSDDTQVTELLEKIEEMVAANSGCHFELDRTVLLDLVNKRAAEKRRAKERMMKVQNKREDLRSHMCHSHCLSELRIVLLGYRNAGKSSAGNTILNREEFELKRTAQCVKRQREVAGRHITVIEAPGWWKNEPVEENTELLKQEIVLSVSLCPPGPHAILLTLRVDTIFKERERTVLEGHLKHLTESEWSYTILLFTFGDCLGDKTIEQHIESEGKDLQWLVEKCGNRYHVLNNENRSDDTQVTELLEKIEEMVAANSGCHFEMDRQILQEVEEENREDLRSHACKSSHE